MESQANELVESWINGNRLWVVAEIFRQSKKDAIILAAEIADKLGGFSNDPNYEQVRGFLRLLNMHEIDGRTLPHCDGH